MDYLNNDAFLDIAVTNQSSGNVSILMSNSGTSFNAPVSVSLGATTQPIDLTIVDIDNNTSNDIFVACNIVPTANIKRLDNNGSGIFTLSGTVYSTGSLKAQSIDHGDIDGDSDMDIIVLESNLTSSYRIARLWNNGSGTLTTNTSPVQSGVGAKNIKIVDINSDGKKELIVSLSNTSSNGSGEIATYFATTTGTNTGYMYSNAQSSMRFATKLFPTFMAIADFNNDTRLDVAITDNVSNEINIHYNTTPKFTAGGPLTFCNGNSVDTDFYFCFVV